MIAWRGLDVLEDKKTMLTNLQHRFSAGELNSFS